MTLKKFGASDLITAIKANDLEAVIQALDAGGNIEEPDIHGFGGLPLRTACFSGNLQIIRELLDRGADVNAKTANGSGAPLRSALRAGHRQIAALILSHDAEVPADITIDAELQALAAGIKAGTETLQLPPTLPDAPQAATRPDLEFTPPEPAPPVRKDTSSVVDFLSSLPDHLIEEVNLKGGSYGVDTNILSLDFERSEERWQKPNDSPEDEAANKSEAAKGSFWKIGK